MSDERQTANDEAAAEDGANKNITEKEEQDNLCNFSEKKNIEAECERLLKNIKRQVKQMMEEAVTKKFIHEDSCSIISLCVAVDACVSHGLRRRTLDQLLAFKTNSQSQALIQRVARTGLEAAQQVLDQVEAEEKRTLADQQKVSRRLSLAAYHNNQSNSSETQLQQQHSNSVNGYGRAREPVQRSPSNSTVYKRNLWIKYALIENKLVPIVEYLGKNSTKFYEADALMSNYLCAQILSSLLVGLSALDFSRGKTNNCYQFDEPTADELMKRHKLINPIACTMCNHHLSVDQQQQQPANKHQTLSRSITEGNRSTEKRPESATTENSEEELTSKPTRANSLMSDKQQQTTGRTNLKLKPLALKTSLKCGGTLITECHHYACQEISERHAGNKGYSFLWCSPQNSSSASSPSSAALSTAQPAEKSSTCPHRSPADWPLWSPRMLHETLHQNSRSHLLYAKNNVLLETQPDRRVAGYLSLHQTHSDLILKWIPNQMINGGRCVAVESHESTATAPLDCFYLDLVVNLSLSRVVLLQCQLQRHPIRSQSDSSDSMPPSQRGSKQQQSITEESLILIEADGVQRPPFKFPKGGLRSLLSCLEQGLAPERHLELAIRFHDDDDDDDRSPPDSFDRPSAQSEPPKSPSRLDRLLRRLPSARRRNSSSSGKPTSTTSNQSGPASLADSSNTITSEPTPPKTEQEETMTSTKVLPTINHIYRIVSTSHSPLDLAGASGGHHQTPPLSAMSLNSSTSSGGSACNGSGTGKNNRQQAEQFRWSLSRLTRFSASSSTKNNDQQQAADSISTGAAGSLDRTIDELDGDELANSDSNSSANKKKATEPLDDELLAALRTESIKTLCDSMRKQILSRAFYGWLLHCRRMRIIRTHLTKLVLLDSLTDPDDLEASAQVAGEPNSSSCGLTRAKWQQIMSKREELSESELSRQVNELVYVSGIDDDNDDDDNGLRREVWPYLLEHYRFKDSGEQRADRDRVARDAYESCGRDWIRIERVVKQRDRAILEANMARASRDMRRQQNKLIKEGEEATTATGDSLGADEELSVRSEDIEEQEAADEDQQPLSIVEQAPNELEEHTDKLLEDESPATKQKVKAKIRRGRQRARLESTGSVGSDASLTDQFGNNIHRIDKDVQRCDRNFWYFKGAANLEKLRNIMCTYVWQHLDVGYVQGMCDLAAPFLVVFDDEVLAFSCFQQLMKRMVANFPHGCAMDQHFESLQHLMQVLDPKLYDIFQCNGDYTHFYFCYRWLLLDFKRELAYEDVYRVWETIWSARKVATEHFVVFMALAMVRYYRDIIIENNMDFTDTIKFFNEMAEKHDARKIMALARDCIVELQNMIRS